MTDNNLVYRTLIHHGAQTSAKDGAGNTPGQYNKNKKLLTKTMLLNFVNNVTEQPKTKVKKDVKQGKPKVTKPEHKDENSQPSDDKEIYSDGVDALDLEKIDSILATLSKAEDGLKHSGSRSKFPVPLEVLESLKMR